MSKQMISRGQYISFFFVEKESNNTLSLNSVGTVKRSAGYQKHAAILHS